MCDFTLGSTWTVTNVNVLCLCLLLTAETVPRVRLYTALLKLANWPKQSIFIRVLDGYVLIPCICPNSSVKPVLSVKPVP